MWLRCAAAAGLLSTATLFAQQGPPSAAWASVIKADWSPETRRGALTIWRVVAVGPPRPVSLASLSQEVHSQTSGSFGQTAGSFGSTAGSTGQTTGSFGQSAGNTGKSAGSFGKSVGSFGESTGTLASAAAAANGSNAIAPKSDTAASRLSHDFGDGHSGIDGLATAVEEVGVDELQTRLDAVAGSPDAPDVLVGTPLPQAWSDQNSGLVRRYGLVTLGAVNLIAQTESEERAPATLEASILVRAPHPRSAREFIKWLSDRDAYQPHPPLDKDVPSVLARTALRSVLFGQGIGAAADKQMAVCNAQIAQQAALGVYGDGLLDGLRVDIDPSFVHANERFAVVRLRAVMESPGAFGVVHAVVVLRVDEAGQWRVLQLTPSLVPEQQAVAWGSLVGYAKKVKRENVAEVKGVRQAAPIDGDNRGPSPDLWWDNGGGATLEIVEWQRGIGTNWSSSNLYFVPDEEGHLRTRVTGRFADRSGTYRWRIWSVGSGGVVAISQWRGLNVVAP